MEESILRVNRLRVYYTGHCALELEQFKVNTGELVGVIGANGGGKSTLVNSILGWTSTTAKILGDIQFCGADITHWPTHRRVRSGLALVPEARSVFMQLTVADNLELSFDRSDVKGRHFYSQEDIYRLFPILKVRKAHRGTQLSGGERQMLGIGRSLMMGPKMIMLDEPSIGLAPKLVTQVLGVLKELAEEGLTILLVEQNFKAAIRIVDRVMVLERGRVALEGNAKDIADDPRVARAYLGGNRK